MAKITLLLAKQTVRNLSFWWSFHKMDEKTLAKQQNR